MKFVFRLLWLWLLLPALATAQRSYTLIGADETADSMRVSLLTCAPGHKIWRLYGHTAVRIDNPKEHKNDRVYNYGLFSFGKPDFLVKFIFGLTDYSMGRESTALFLSTYLNDDMPVTQQVLNLTRQQAEHLQAELDAVLNDNGFERKTIVTERLDGTPDTLVADVPHWHYRYNFLYDNCTTRAVEAIVRAVESTGEKIIYPSLETSRQTVTQREMIHEFTAGSPWNELGQDFLLGPEVDRRHSIRQMTTLNFLPVYAQNFFAGALIKGRDGRTRSLVSETEPLLPFVGKNRAESRSLSPSVVFWTLSGLVVLLTLGDLRSRKKSPITRRAWRIWTNAFDTVFFIGMGLVGMLLSFMVIWSQHPAVGTNWLLTICHPLLLLHAALRPLIRRRWQRDPGALLMAAGAALYFVALFGGWQHFPSSATALALILLIRSLASFFTTGREARA